MEALCNVCAAVMPATPAPRIATLVLVQVSLRGIDAASLEPSRRPRDIERS